MCLHDAAPPNVVLTQGCEMFEPARGTAAQHICYESHTFQITPDHTINAVSQNQLVMITAHLGFHRVTTKPQSWGYLWRRARAAGGPCPAALKLLGFGVKKGWNVGSWLAHADDEQESHQIHQPPRVCSKHFLTTRILLTHRWLQQIKSSSQLSFPARNRLLQKKLGDDEEQYLMVPSTGVTL